jgi:hypothetical protein
MKTNTQVQKAGEFDTKEFVSENNYCICCNQSKFIVFDTPGEERLELHTKTCCGYYKPITSIPLSNIIEITFEKDYHPYSKFFLFQYFVQYKIGSCMFVPLKMSYEKRDFKKIKSQVFNILSQTLRRA